MTNTKPLAAKSHPNSTCSSLTNDAIRKADVTAPDASVQFRNFRTSSLMRKRACNGRASARCRSIHANAERRTPNALRRTATGRINSLS